MDTGVLELFTSGDSSIIDQVAVPCGAKGALSQELRQFARAADSGGTVDEADRKDAQSSDTYMAKLSVRRESWKGERAPYKFPEQTVVPAFLVMLTYGIGQSQMRRGTGHGLIKLTFSSRVIWTTVARALAKASAHFLDARPVDECLSLFRAKSRCDKSVGREDTSEGALVSATRMLKLWVTERCMLGTSVLES